MIDLNKLMAEQAARQLADATLAEAAGPTQSNVASSPVCLVTRFAKRSDTPATTSQIKMSAKVFNTLGIKGLQEPVSLRLLPSLWWVAQVDVSGDNPSFEAGGATTEVVATTEKLIHHYSFAYCEVTQGPFGSRDEVDGFCFASDTFDGRALGERARVIVVPPWSERRLAEQGLTEPIPLSALLGKWWVCGLGGGVCVTEDLASATDGMLRISDGPFEAKEDADYAFDVMWESPE